VRYYMPQNMIDIKPVRLTHCPIKHRDLSSSYKTLGNG
jgi:hypothetical protein